MLGLARGRRRAGAVGRRGRAARRRRRRVARRRGVAGAGAAASAYPFFGEHQAGIVTPAQDRLHFAAFDVAETLDRDGLIELLTEWTDAAARLTPGPGGRRGRSGRRSATRRRTTPARRWGCPPAGSRSRSDSGPASSRRQGRDRFGLADSAARRARAAAAFPGRRAAARALRRRPLHPGLRRRPAGRRARHPQPQPHRVRPRDPALVAARLRPHLVDVDEPGHAAQPLRLQGRHREHQGRGDDGRRRARLGAGGDEPAWLAGGSLPRRAHASA